MSDEIHNGPQHHEAIKSISLGEISVRSHRPRKKANSSNSNRNTGGSKNSHMVGYIPIMDCFADVGRACDKWLRENRDPADYKSDWKKKNKP